MNLYIDCSIVESDKYVTKMQVFLDENLVIESLLQKADFSVVHIPLNKESSLRLHFEPVRKRNISYELHQTCSYDDLESLYPGILSRQDIEYMKGRQKEGMQDSFICPISWIYAYDTVIESVSASEECLVFMFSDEFIHADVQVADLIFPKSEQERVKLSKCISEQQLQKELLKRNILHWGLYALMFTIWFPLYYWLYGMLTASVRHLYVIQNGIFALLPYIALPFSLFFVFLLWKSWKGTYRAIKETNELVLTNDIREAKKAAKDLEREVS